MSKKRFLALLGVAATFMDSRSTSVFKDDTTNLIPQQVSDTSSPRVGKYRAGTKKKPISNKKRKSKRRMVKASRQQNQR